MKIQWTDPASDDVVAIRDYISRDSDHYAQQFASRIIEIVDELADFPRRGRHVPESDDPDVRELLFQNYRIMYRVEPERVLVLAVVHGARDLSRMTPRPWEIV